MGEAELERLLDHGADWLPSHPARDEIVGRYLKHQPSEAELESRITLNDHRLSVVLREFEIACWEQLTAAGGEGMVVKPLAWLARGRRASLYCVHECVFGVLALESEPVDPRL